MTAPGDPSASTVLDVWAQPGARTEKIGPIRDGALRVAVRARAEKGKANKAVLDALAKSLGLPPSNLELIRGATGRRKRVRVTGLSADEAQRFLERFSKG